MEESALSAGGPAALPEVPGALLTEPTKAAGFPGVALGEKEPAAEAVPAAPAAAEPTEPAGQPAQPEPTLEAKDLPDELLEKFEKHPRFQSRVDKTVAKALQTAEQRWQAKQAEE